MYTGVNTNFEIISHITIRKDKLLKSPQSSILLSEMQNTSSALNLSLQDSYTEYEFDSELCPTKTMK
jgi:hypothetical protein